MTKKNLLIFLLTIGALATSTLTFFLLKTQRLPFGKKAAEEYKSLYFTATDGSYEAILSYKFEYPKFFWRFDKLTCAKDKALVQRRFLHIGKTIEEVAREGWIDQSFFQWSLGDPLPSGEVDIPIDKGCFFQLDATMTIKPINGQTSDETNGIVKNDKGPIIGCGEVQPSLTPTVVPTVQPTVTLIPTLVPSIQPTATLIPNPTATKTPVPINTQTPIPTATRTPTPSIGPSPTASVTPQNSPTPAPTIIVTTTPQPTATNTPIVPTSTSRPLPTATTKPIAQATPTDVSLEVGGQQPGLNIPSIWGILGGFAIMAIGFALVL